MASGGSSLVAVHGLLTAVTLLLGNTGSRGRGSRAGLWGGAMGAGL